MRQFILISTCIMTLALSSGLRGQTMKPHRCPDVELQKLQLVFMRLEPGPEPLFIDDRFGDAPQLEVSEVQKLKRIGFKGLLKFEGGGTFGELVGCKAERQARVIIVGQRPIKQPVELAQPDGVNVIYYQMGNKWKMIPAYAQVLKRKIL